MTTKTNRLRRTLGWFLNFPALLCLALASAILISCTTTQRMPVTLAAPPQVISSQPIELEIESQFWPPTVRLAWPSVPGERYVLESSDNLIDWTRVHEQTAGSSGLVFHAERSWFGERYYRVKQITNGR